MPCLTNLYLRVYLAPSSPDPKSFILDICRVNPRHLVTPRIVAYDETTSNEALQDDIDALDEVRDVVLARATQYQQSLRNYHSTRVCPRSFVVGDLML
jgi:hypothetical protein